MPKPSNDDSASIVRKSNLPSLLFKLLLAGSVFFFLFAIYCDARIRTVFDNRVWQTPSKVYGRPLLLAPGVSLTRDEFLIELAGLGYSKEPELSRPGSFVVEPGRVKVYQRKFNFPEGLQEANRFQVNFSGSYISGVRNEAGQAVTEIVLEPQVIGGVYPGVAEDRLFTRLEEVPRLLVETLLEVEDKDFYQHAGISLRGISRAMIANIKAGRTVQGGSTLTQQLVKNLVLTRERSFSRKIQEAMMSLLLEIHFTKDQILEAYINEVYLGQEGSRAIHGFSLAAYHYFNRPLKELSISQVSMLVGLVKGPSYYDPWRYPERAQDRRNIVLATIGATGWLTPESLAEQQAKPLELAKASAVDGVYPAYIDLVRRQLKRDYDNEQLHTEGLRIFTPFDPLLQRRAEKALTEELGKLNKSHKDLQAAVVVTGVRSGDILAVVGGRRPRYAGFNRALDALRPIGSLVKPAVYLSALSRPREFTLASFIRDEELAFRNPDGSYWTPRNYDKKSHGLVMMHEALSKSYNQAAARLGLNVGIDNVLETLKRLGVKRPLPEVPSLFLGAAELSPIEVSAMYQTIAAGGESQALRAIYAVTDAEGKLLARYPQHPEQTVREDAIHLLHYAMQEVVREGTGRGVYAALPADYRVAGKTGTSNDLRDSWFAGFAGDYLTVVWMGNDNNSSANLTGSSGALKVWRNFMAKASREPMPFVQTPGVEYIWVDELTGEVSEEGCDNARRMPFIAGSEPIQHSPCYTNRPKRWQWFQRIFDR